MSRVEFFVPLRQWLARRRIERVLNERPMTVAKALDEIRHLLVWIASILTLVAMKYLGVFAYLEALRG